MKLRLPSDIEGGLMIFAIVIGITVIQLYFFSKIRANLGEAHTHGPRKKCEKAGGKWIPNEDTNDPCCKSPNSLEYDGPLCGGPLRFEGEGKDNEFCTEACLHDPNSGFCTEACTFKA